MPGEDQEWLLIRQLPKLEHYGLGHELHVIRDLTDEEYATFQTHRRMLNRYSFGWAWEPITKAADNVRDALQDSVDTADRSIGHLSELVSTWLAGLPDADSSNADEVRSAAEQVSAPRTSVALLLNAPGRIDPTDILELLGPSLSALKKVAILDLVGRADAVDEAAKFFAAFQAECSYGIPAIIRRGDLARRSDGRGMVRLPIGEINTTITNIRLAERLLRTPLRRSPYNPRSS